MININPFNLFKDDTVTEIEQNPLIEKPKVNLHDHIQPVTNKRHHKLDIITCDRQHNHDPSGCRIYLRRQYDSSPFKSFVD